MAEKQSLSTKVVDTFGKIVAKQVDAHPQRARELLLDAFKLKRWQCRHLPERKQLPSGKMGSRIALEGVTSALEDPEHAVLTSIFMPNEMFLAMGLKPVSAEAISDFITAAHAEDTFISHAEQTGVPETFCSYHKILTGTALTDVLPQLKFIAHCTVACDANNITFKWLARKMECEHFYVDVPYEPNDEAVHYVARQLEETARMAQDIYHVTLDEQALKEAVNRSENTLNNLVQALPLRKNHYLANDMGLEMQQALALHLSLGTTDTQEMTQAMLEDYAHAQNYQGLNLIWIHTTPFFSPSLQEQIDMNQKAQIIASDMVHDQILPDGYTYHADTPYLAMAERLVYNAFNGPATRRVERIKHLADTCDADGVVVFCHWGCKETLGASQLIKHELEKEGYPVLVLDGDGSNRANCAEGQTATRMGAFLEMLEKNKQTTKGEA